MKNKPFGQIYFTGLIVSLVTIASTLSGCAQFYYGTFRYEAECVDHPAHNETLCKVEKTK